MANQAGAANTWTESRSDAMGGTGVASGSYGSGALINPALLAKAKPDDDVTVILPSVGVVRAMYPYIERELSNGTYLGHITRHMLGLFQGIPGARQWRRSLSDNAHKAGADIEVLEHALRLVADKR